MHNIMNTMLLAAILLAAAGSIGATSPRTVTTLRDGWQFSRGHGADATEWIAVHVPHDWAIYGPFDRSNDLQVVAVEQNGEKFETAKTGRTGGLPLVGKATYRTTFNVADKDGNLVPNDSREVRFAVSGAGTFETTANGDPTSLRSFQQPAMDLFSGAATAIVRSSATPGAVTLSVAADDLPTASLTLPVVAGK